MVSKKSSTFVFEIGGEILEVVKGCVDHIIFRNEENGYTVFQLENDEGELTCVGTFPYLNEGEMVEVSGEYTTHNMYGLQLQVRSIEMLEPEDLASIERYLGSGAIKGLGSVLAGRIVRRFKEDTFRVLEEEPERLAEIQGISLRMAQSIAVQIEEKKDMRSAMIYLQKYGVTLALAAKIFEYYGQEMYGVMEENPYQIADRIPGVGFKTVDEIAKNVGLHTDSDYRIRSGLVYTLLQAVGEGHIYLPTEELCRRAGALLEIDLQDITTYLLDLSVEKKIVVKAAEEGERVYPAQYYYMELNTAKMLSEMNLSCEIADVVVENRLQAIERENQLDLDDMQRQAVYMAARYGLLVLTGGPGTGKTTTINALIQFFESEGMEIALAAPTGRAAKRMTEATGYEAKTIHRMLELGYLSEQENRMYYGRNDENPLEADVVIVDEMSMVDLPLMQALLRAIAPGTRLILVGDQDQLPSVGPGCVLKDIIASECFRVVKLTKIFRQAERSDIVVNAHKINRGEEVSLDNKSMDFFFLKREDANVIIQVMLTLIQKKLPGYVQATPYDIQVLTPMRKGLLGVERLNGILQQHLNTPSPEKAEKTYGDKLFRVGDKVMQIKNNYQLEWEIATKKGLVVDRGVGVFNGDMGKIIQINSFMETLQVEFEEKKTVTYSFSMLEELELAYAVTIHKSQGSEYPAVVMPLLAGPRQLFYRNLLYTAVTRARKCVVMVGSDETFREMVRNGDVQNRYTSLKERITEIQTGV